jgi:hypothetical protein
MLSAHVELFGRPWEPDPAAPYRSLTLDDYAEFHEAIPPGVLARHRSSVFDPVQVPDLIGVRNRRYLDRSGLQTHQSIVDLMRYGALNQGGDDLASFGGFLPSGKDNTQLPPASSQTRYSDDHRYALARYLYALTPPPNPNKPGPLTEEGRRIFERERCSTCHTPPLYTNNRLLPVLRFSQRRTAPHTTSLRDRLTQIQPLPLRRDGEPGITKFRPSWGFGIAARSSIVAVSRR